MTSGACVCLKLVSGIVFWHYLNVTCGAILCFGMRCRLFVGTAQSLLWACVPGTGWRCRETWGTRLLCSAAAGRLIWSPGLVPWASSSLRVHLASCSLLCLVSENRAATRCGSSILLVPSSAWLFYLGGLWTAQQVPSWNPVCGASESGACPRSREPLLVPSHTRSVACFASVKVKTDNLLTCQRVP